jgi:hypothetical protein
MKKTALVVVAVVSAAIVSAGLLVYFRKRNSSGYGLIKRRH